MADPNFQRIESRFCGVGGQGIVLGTTILADAAIFHEGKYALQSPTYGSQVRGGPTKVDLIVDTREIMYPKAKHLNFFLAIAQSSFNKYFHDLSENCTVLVDENLVNLPESVMSNSNLRIYRLPVIEMAKKEFNNVTLANMICLGITIEVTKVVSQDSLLKSVKKLVPSKHYEKNVAAVAMGVEIAKTRSRESVPV